MAITLVTLTADPSTLVGADPSSAVRVVVRTNTEGAIVDADGNDIYLGTHAESITGSATFSATLPPTNGVTNPTGFQYAVDLEYVDAATRQRKKWTSGWFSLTASADLADVVVEQYVPPTYMSTATATLDGYVTQAEAARDAAVDISNIDTSDAVVEALVLNTGGAGPLTSAALSASIAMYADLPALLAETDALTAGRVILTRAEKYAYVVEPGGSTDYHLTTAGGSLLRVSDDNPVVAPVMFGAVGDGTTDDRDAVQTCWTWSGARSVPVDMQGLEYACAGDVTTRSNLTIHARGAVMYVTAWPATGAFVSNVVENDPAARVQSNIRIHDLIVDGSQLPAPTSTQNCNLLDFARGASNVRVVNCTARYMRHGFGGGTGGAGFGGEQGLEDVIFDGCTVHDCYRGVRVAGLPGTHADAAAEAKNAIGVVFRDLTIRNCSAATYCHSMGEDTGDTASDLSVFDALFDGLYIEDCGHAAWYDMDYTTYPTIVPQKSGVLVFAGAQNVRMRGIRVKLNSDYTTRADWLGRSGYPGAGTSYIGAGLSGNVGALVWGWGRNIVIEDAALDGEVDCARRLARCPSLGEIASTAPGRSTAPNEQNRITMSHVRGTTLAHVVDGWRASDGTGLDNTYTSEVVTFTTFAAPSTAVVSAAAIPSGGLSGITNLQVDFRRFHGSSVVGSADAWLTDTSVSTSVAATVRKDGGAWGGGYSSTGAKNGLTYDPAGFLRSSRNAATSVQHALFYNPNGAVGSISTNGSSTVYSTSSDARLKTDLRDFDGLAILRNLGVYDFAWLADGRRSYGVIAQEIQDLLPVAVTEDPDTGMLGVDYSKLVPILMRALMQLCDEVEELACSADSPDAPDAHRETYVQGQ